MIPTPSPQTIEEASLNAWPALKHMLFDGWVLRFAAGYSRRNNSVNAIYPGRLPLEAKIARCEAIFRERGLPPTFRITPLVQPAELDSVLEAAGYARISPTEVHVVSLADIPPPNGSGEAHGWPAPDEAWVAAYSRMNDVPLAKHATLRQILAHIPGETCFMTIRRNDQIVACGLGVREGPLVGYFDIVTDPNHRRQGVGLQLMRHLMQWAKQCGATHAYLQVVAGNTPAINMYAGLGFREIYPYWYRVKG
jgi:GNAT superfamily N-acetyltransferase